MIEEKKKNYRDYDITNEEEYFSEYDSLLIKHLPPILDIFYSKSEHYRLRKKEGGEDKLGVFDTHWAEIANNICTEYKKSSAVHGKITTSLSKASSGRINKAVESLGSLLYKDYPLGKLIIKLKEYNNK